MDRAKQHRCSTKVTCSHQVTSFSKSVAEGIIRRVGSQRDYTGSFRTTFSQEFLYLSHLLPVERSGWLFLNCLKNNG